MDSEPQIIPDNPAEARKINVLLERYREDLGGFDVVQVGDAGYIVQRQSHKPMSGNDWAMFDYDDTLAAYTESKTQRLDLYKKYVQTLGIHISDDQVEELMRAADTFSRWEVNENGGRVYHLNAHLAALQWATNQLKDNTVSTEMSIAKVKELLASIKSQTPNSTLNHNADPFYIRARDKKFILRDVNQMWSDELLEVFKQTTMSPRAYDETITAVKDIGTPIDSIHRINLGIFTYGEADFQLSKILELLKQNPDLPISQIWLTKKSKGNFIIEAVENNATALLPQDYPSQELLQDEDEGPSFGSGNVLGQFQHVIVMLDDNPKELNSILSTNDYLKEHTGASFVLVRSIRKDTKEQLREWQVQTQHGKVDFTEKTFVSRDISNVFLINRYFSVRSRLGINHPNTKRLLIELVRRGIHIPQ